MARAWRATRATPPISAASASRASSLAQVLTLEERLLHPRIGGARASWDDALATIARAFGETIAAHGPDSVAFYVSGQLLTEDYYVANKLMKGFVGSANIDTNSRLCMSASVAGHKRAFGSDTVPGCYEDLEEADLVILVGSNLAWCHPILFQRLAAARERRGGLPKIVNIDPRRTATSEIADLQLSLAPGSRCRFVCWPAAGVEPRRQAREEVRRGLDQGRRRGARRRQSLDARKGRRGDRPQPRGPATFL